MWKHDPSRTGSTPRPLPERLRLQWTREMPPIQIAWPDQPRLQVETAYEPIVVGHTMFVASASHDCVRAYDTRTGLEKWVFFTDGPVRFAPAADDGRLYFSSDDGFLYCVALETGELIWKFRGGPADRRILGNDRLISTWPARGAPVVADGVVYFAAGIWPFMGTFIHALDARTGKVIWTNEGDGSTYIQQPHNVDAFAGVAPQGPIVVIGDKLLLPGGRSVPACYDRKTGKLVFFKFADNGRRGGADAAAVGGLFFAGGMAYDLSTGLYVGEFSHALALSSDLICYGGRSKDLLIARPPTMTMIETVDRKGAKMMKAQWKMAPPETVEGPWVSAVMRAGNRVYVGSENRVTAYQLATKTKEAWHVDLKGTPASLIAADDRLFVVTHEGAIHCFGADAGTPSVHRVETSESAGSGSLELEAARAAGVSEGYAVDFLSSGRLPAGLSRTDLRVILVSPGASDLKPLREELVRSGLFGLRAVVHEGTAESFPLPSYLASAIFAPAKISGPPVLRKLYEVLRPYGGKLFLPKEGYDLFALLAEAKLEGATIEESGKYWVIVRAGGLPGAGNWTHEHADAANTRVSKDRIVKAPLGLLWFGGPSHEGILPRHGHGPQPQVLDGRLFIEGVHKLRAVDIYTGRLLWETSLPGVGDFYNNVIHQPGANAAGSNFVSTSDGIYVAWKKRCVRLDPATGKILSEFEAPGAGAEWSCINLSGDYLVGGAEPLMETTVLKQEQGGYDDPLAPLAPADAAAKKLMSFKPDNDNRSSSRRIFVMDRRTGKVLWQATSRLGFRHNSLCIGGGKLFVIDRFSGPQVDRLKKKGHAPLQKPRIVAYDLKDGREVWSSDDAVFGTWLSYSEARDVLVEAGRVARDTINDEPKDMRAWKGADGKVLWKKNYPGPAMIHGDTILTGEKACDLMTGAPRGRIHPITGLPVEWSWTRNYGCNTPAASENLLTFRSGAAGYFDLAGDGGTGNFGGFRSSCTNNLIVAGGLINAPDYTRTCICSYQNQASVALVPMPEAEMWTFFGTTEVKGAVKRLGVNLGAPGDRRADDGTLWVEHPGVGGKSPLAPVALDGKIEYFRRNSLRLSGGLPWVAASGAKGLTSLTMTVDKEAQEEKPYTVRLHFAEPDGLGPGERVFDVTLQGAPVLTNFDVSAEAGGSDRAIIKEFTAGVAKDLKLKFIPRKSSTLLCGIEVLAGGEMPVARNVVHTDLTVPESAVLLKPREETTSAADEAPLRSFLWIGTGAMLFMWMFFRFNLLRRRPA